MKKNKTLKKTAKRSPKVKKTTNVIKKPTKDEKIRAELRELRKEIKNAKKSKQRMQFLWYRTKKEHVALIKDIEMRLKAVKKSLAKSK